MLFQDVTRQSRIVRQQLIDMLCSVASIFEEIDTWENLVSTVVTKFQNLEDLKAIVVKKLGAQEILTIYAQYEKSTTMKDILERTREKSIEVSRGQF